MLSDRLFAFLEFMKNQIEPINVPENHTDDDSKKLKCPTWWDEYEPETTEIHEDSRSSETHKVH